MNRNDLREHNPVFIKTKMVEEYKEHFKEICSKAFEKPHYVGMAMEAEHVLIELFGLKNEEVQELMREATQMQAKQIEPLIKKD